MYLLSFIVYSRLTGKKKPAPLGTSLENSAQAYGELIYLPPDEDCSPERQKQLSRNCFTVGERSVKAM